MTESEIVKFWGFLYKCSFCSSLFVCELMSVIGTKGAGLGKAVFYSKESKDRSLASITWLVIQCSDQLSFTFLYLARNN